MPDDAVARLARSLGRYQAIVVGGLAFIVALTITVMGVLLYLSFSLGQQSARLEAVATETHNVLCAQYGQLLEQQRGARRLLRENHLSPEVALVIQRNSAIRDDAIKAMKGAGLSC